MHANGHGNGAIHIPEPPCMTVMNVQAIMTPTSAHYEHVHGPKYRVQAYVVTLGHGGSVFSQLDFLRTLYGASQARITQRVRSLSRNALAYGHQIISVRRAEEGKLYGTPNHAH